MQSHADAVRSYIRDGRGSAVLHSTSNQDPQPRDSPEGSRPYLSGGRDAGVLHSAALQQLSHNDSADATNSRRSSVNIDKDDKSLRSAMSQGLVHEVCSSDLSRADPTDSRHVASLPAASALQSKFASSTASLSCTQALGPESGCADNQRIASEGRAADSTLANRPGEAITSNSQTPWPQVPGKEQPQLEISQFLIHNAVSPYSADKSPGSGAAATETLDRASSDAGYGLSNSESAEKSQLSEDNEMPDLSGLWAIAADMGSSDGQGNQLCSSEAPPDAQVLPACRELEVSEKTARLQEPPCLNGLSSMKIVKKARGDDKADISDHTEDIIPALFWEAQEAHICAMHAELDSSLAGNVDIKSWASEDFRATNDTAHAQLKEQEEQRNDAVCQALGTAISDKLQQEGGLGCSREAFLSIAPVYAAATPAVSYSLPCVSSAATMPDITLQATAMDVPRTGARDGLMPAPELCHLAPVSGAAAQEDATAASTSQKGVQRGRREKKRTRCSAKKGCSTRPPAIRLLARGQGQAKAAANINDKAEILAAVLALQMAVAEQAASIAQLKDEFTRRSATSLPAVLEHAE